MGMGMGMMDHDTRRGHRVLDLGAGVRCELLKSWRIIISDMHFFNHVLCMVVASGVRSSYLLH